jgi:hypothetical protein
MEIIDGIATQVGCVIGPVLSVMCPGQRGTPQECTGVMVSSTAYSSRMYW